MLKRHTTLLMIALAGFTGDACANMGDGWIVKITASTGLAGEYRSTVTLGEFADAVDGYDVKYDAPAFPSLENPITARFSHPEWNQNSRDFLYDIRAIRTVQPWSFDTESTLPGQNVTLEWNLAQLPADYALTLTDVTTGASIDMSTRSSYSFPNSGPRAFTVAAAEKTAIDTPPVADAAASSGSGGGMLDGISCVAALAWLIVARRRKGNSQ